MPVRPDLDLISQLDESQADELCGSDFLLTWEKSLPALGHILQVASILRAMSSANISPRVFDSGLAISQFRDNSTRTRFSFSSAANLLGLAVQELDEGTSQIAHGETVRETANMISFMAEVIGIRDDMYIGKGNTYMREVAEAVAQGYAEGVLEQRPTVINLQCDIDHPTQTMADLLHAAEHFGGIERLRGKRLAMTWAYSPSYGKPLSVPQGIIGLFTRFGVEVRLAYPPGYDLMPDVVEQAGKNTGALRICNSMEEAFEDAEIVYPKSWAPFGIMEERTVLLEKQDTDGFDSLEKRCLLTNSRFEGWECTRKLMDTTNNALYMHCLPADITGVSCESGEVASDVFDAFRVPLFRQASFKPYIIAAMIFTAKMPNAGKTLLEIAERSPKRIA